MREDIASQLAGFKGRGGLELVLDADRIITGCCVPVGPGVLVEQIEEVAGTFSDAGHGSRARRSGEAVGDGERAFGGARTGDGVGSAGTSEVPVVGPIAVKQREIGNGDSPETIEEILGCDVPDRRLAAGFVPLPDETGDRKVRRRVVPHLGRGGRGEVEEVVRVPDALQVRDILGEATLHRVERTFPR